MEKNLKKSSSILGIKKLNVLEQNAVRGGKADKHIDVDRDTASLHEHIHIHTPDN